jgi:aspartate/methionine/tyrosine aminotransferase
MARAKSVSGEKLHSLGLGEPFWPAPDTVRQKLSEIALSEHYGYKSPFGNQILRQSIAGDVTAIADTLIEAENILVTAGAKQALSVVFKTLLEDDDEAIVVDPCFVSYRPQVFLANHNAKIIPFSLSDDFSIDMEALKALITPRSKVLVVNSPNNPSGGLISAVEMQALVAVAKDHNMYLVCDEIYRDFVYHGATFVSANAYRDTYAQIITIDGFSKTYGMTGWRLGYIVASKEFLQNAVKVVQHEMTNVPEILQVAACEAFHLPDGWFEQYRCVLERNVDHYNNAIEGISILKTAPIQAGMFCFPKFDLGDFTSDQVAVKLLHAQNVAVTPGVVFGKDWDSYLRVSLSSPEDEFHDAIEKFATFFRTFL